MQVQVSFADFRVCSNFFIACYMSCISAPSLIISTSTRMYTASNLKGCRTRGEANHQLRYTRRWRKRGRSKSGASATRFTCNADKDPAEVSRYCQVDEARQSLLRVCDVLD